MLIAVGFLSVPYILQSSAAPWAFSFGVVWEGPIFVITLALILAFPTGRLDGRVERLILAAAVVGVVVPSPSVCDGGAADRRERHDLQLQRRVPGERAARLAAPRAGRRSDRRHPHHDRRARPRDDGPDRAGASPPERRRAGARSRSARRSRSCSSATQIAHQVAQAVQPGRGTLDDVIRWSLRRSRAPRSGTASCWRSSPPSCSPGACCGASSRHRCGARPCARSRRCCAGRSAIPRLRLAFWRSGSRRLGRRRRCTPSEPSDGRVLTAVERDGRPAVAIIHDAQLAEDPELVHAAGAVALLAQENARARAGLDRLAATAARLARAHRRRRRGRAARARARPPRRGAAAAHGRAGEAGARRRAAPAGIGRPGPARRARVRARADAAGAAPARPRHLPGRRWPRPASSARSRPSRRAPGARSTSPATASGATRPRSSPPSTTAAWRRCRTRRSTPGPGPASRSALREAGDRAALRGARRRPGLRPGRGARRRRACATCATGSTRFTAASRSPRRRVVDRWSPERCRSPEPRRCGSWSSRRQPRSTPWTAAAPMIGSGGGVSVGG